MSYEATVKIAKKDNMTPDICSVIQIAQIPGISSKIARTIVDEYGSLYNLCLRYRELGKLEDPDHSKCEKLLSNLKYKTKTDKWIRIGDKRSKYVYEYLVR